MRVILDWSEECRGKRQRELIETTEKLLANPPSVNPVDLPPIDAQLPNLPTPGDSNAATWNTIARYSTATKRSTVPRMFGKIRS